jgi:uncharacterized membrane protein
MGISQILNSLIPILLTLGVVLFVYGLISLLFAKDEQKKKNRKKIIWWGFVLALVVFIFWAIIAATAQTMGPQPVPDVILPAS